MVSSKVTVSSIFRGTRYIKNYRITSGLFRSDRPVTVTKSFVTFGRSSITVVLISFHTTVRLVLLFPSSKESIEGSIKNPMNVYNHVIHKLFTYSLTDKFQSRCLIDSSINNDWVYCPISRTKSFIHLIQYFV